MTSSLAIALALAALTGGDLAGAAGRFAAAHPAARLVRAPAGGLEHASGLAVPRRVADPEQNARAFLAAEGRAFGVEAAGDLRTLRVWSAPGEGGSALFQRLVGGLPVFGGSVAVGWRADGAITVVNGARSLGGEPRGAFRADAAGARARALAAAPGRPGEARVEQGWLQYEGALYPAYRVEHGATAPLDSFVSYVDGESGRLLYRVSRRRSFPTCPTSCAAGGVASPCICSYRISPLAPAPAASATEGNTPEAFPLLGRSAGSTLTGQRAEVFNCLGADATANPARCTSQTALASGTGDFLASPDPTLRDVTNDHFAEQSAYYHIDGHSRFLDGLDPAFAARTPAGGIGFIAGYVNVLASGAPYDNAFFSPTGGPAGTAGIMVYGQGTLVDIAYDAEIVYHELTHAAVDVTAGFEEYTDAQGANVDPGSVNEGTADTFALAHVMDALAQAGLPVDSASCLSRYFGAELGERCLRQAANARTCRGNGPNDGRNPGRDGEVHDDGEIWTGFTWALLRAAHDHGLRPQVASALFHALEAVGPHPTFLGYASTVRQKMADAGLPAEALAFADCTIAQRDLAGCGDRSVALFSGERAQGAFYGVAGQIGGSTTAGQQYFVDVPCGAVALHVQSGDTTSKGTLYVRYGQPVTFAGAGLTGPHYDWSVPGNAPETVLGASGCPGCDGCLGTRTPFGPGRWYLLPTGPLADAGGNTNLFQLGVSIELPAGTSAPARVAYTIGTAATDPNVCTWGGGAAVQNPVPPIPATPPALACAGPGSALAAAATCSGATPPPSGGKSGCGCGLGTPDGAALALLGLLALRLRRRGPRGR